MRGHDVSQRGRIVVDIVPGKFQARLARQMFEGKIRRQPGGINEIMHRRKALDDVRREKGGRGEDDHLGEIIAFAGANAQASSDLRNVVDHRARAHEPAQFGEQLFDDPAVTLRPGEGALFFRLPGGEVVDARPGGSVAAPRRHSRRGKRS